MGRSTATVKVRGLRELERAIRKLPRLMGKRVLTKALRAGALPMAAAMKQRAPVESGRLRRSIVSRASASIQSGTVAIKIGPSKAAWYAHFVEFGTATHNIRSKLLGPRLKLRDGRIVRKVSHPGAAAQPFMRPAFDETKTLAANIIKQQLVTEVEKAARKLARGSARIRR